MKYKLYVRHEAERWSQVCQATIPESWIGYCDKVRYTGNTALAGEHIRFMGNTKQEVIDQVLAELKSQGLHGKLQVIES